MKEPNQPSKEILGRDHALQALGLPINQRTSAWLESKWELDLKWVSGARKNIKGYSIELIERLKKSPDLPT